MPKITGDPVRPFSLGFRKIDIEFIERVGVGSNLGAKLRSILDRCRMTFDDIAGKPGAFLVYSEKDGERIWNTSPFPLKPKLGWKAIKDAAREVGYIHQIVEDKSIGSIEVWVAPGSQINDCDGCRKRVKEAMHG